ncbi:MAG: CPBP family intramembrane metalloprotease [Xanthomonadales bacterium]|nr:CPBP family intramembrane metalloprotease [Xanthomonadales bacterium]MBK7146405.1 CPBP family intramembrane metalloprotease [Xanthomonadales bacterium]
MNRPVLVFLVLAYAISWGVSELGFRMLQLPAVAVGVAFMFGPALAAVLTTKFVLRRPIASLGPWWRPNRWLAVAVIAPMLFTFAWIAISPLVPGLSVALDSQGLIDNVLTSVPADQQAMVRGELEKLGGALLPMLLLQMTLVAAGVGMTLNAVAAFGEELGWRGFLHQHLATMGFWSRAALVGFFWGLWHLPLTLRGHNYPSHPELGVAMMIAFCLLLAPAFEWIRARSGCVIGPTWLHGTLNALGGAGALVGGSDLMRGPAGAAGMIVLAAFNLGLWWSARRGWTRLQP